MKDLTIEVNGLSVFVLNFAVVGQIIKLCYKFTIPNTLRQEQNDWRPRHVQWHGQLVTPTAG